MSAVIAWLMAEAWPYLAGALAIIGGLFAVRQGGKRAGRQQERARQAQQEQKSKGKADEVDREIDALAGDSVRQRAADWVRRKDGR